MQFEDLFEGITTRFDLVITFLALLEMTKLRMTKLLQEDFSSPIFVEFSAQVGSGEGEEPAAGEESPSAAQTPDDGTET